MIMPNFVAKKGFYVCTTILRPLRILIPIRLQREGSLSRWIGPLCLPMLLAIQPLTAYNLRMCLALLVLASFLAWTQLSKGLKGGLLRKRGGLLRLQRRHQHQQHRHHHHLHYCDKCEQQLADQLGSGVKPVVSWNARTIRRLPLRLVRSLGLSLSLLFLRKL